MKPRFRAGLREAFAIAKFAALIARGWVGKQRLGGKAGELVLDRQRPILVWDEAGKVFDALRLTMGGAPLWRVAERPTRSDLAQADLAIAALYSASDWRKIVPLARRIRTVVVSAQSDPRNGKRALVTGAFGYLELGFRPRALRRAILRAQHDEPAYSRAILGERVRHDLRRPRSRGARRPALTPRQREVWELIATGASDKEIAVVLSIATATAQKHVTRLLRRLGVPNRAAAVAAVLLDGLRQRPSARRARYVPAARRGVRALGELVDVSQEVLVDSTSPR